MSPIVKKDLSFFYQVISLVSLLILVAAIGGVTLVWLRQQIKDTAQQNRRSQTEMAQVENRLRYLETKIAEVNSPAYLRSRAVAMGLSLERPKPQQIVRMTPVDSRPQLPGLSADSFVAERDPYVQSFDLAVMEPVRSAK